MITWEQIVQKGVVPPQNDEPFGLGRYNPELPSVYNSPNVFVEKECDTCGRKFAHKRYKGPKYRTCCQFCSQVWAKNVPVKSRRMYLFFYKGKTAQELKDEFQEELTYYDYSPLELEVLVALKKGPMTSYDLVDKIFGTKYTKSGLVARRVTVIDACNKLIKKRRIRSYPELKKQKQRGRPKTRYKIVKNIVEAHKKCPHCGNNVFAVLKDEQKIQCINCNLKWVVK